MEPMRTTSFLNTPQAVALFQFYFAAGLVASAVDGSDDGIQNEHEAQDLSPAAAAGLAALCERFVQDNQADLVAAAATPGYFDQRAAGGPVGSMQNVYGGGFNAQGLGDVGDRLHAAAQALGPLQLYVGEEDRIEVGGMEAGLELEAISSRRPKP